MFVSFDFEAVAGLAPLTATLPANTSIYHKWPPEHLRVTLPQYQRVASALFGRINFGKIPAYDGHRLMSTPIHVRDGDFLSVSVKNSLQATGLSIHWHGFEMTGHLELDGVVGITQCPISPGESFTYEWEVKETPGTYWYHTHSGELGIDAYNAIMGPLIVHPKLSTEGEDEEMASRDTADNDIPFLDPAIYVNDPHAQQKLSMDELLFYGNERILFFQGGFLHSGAHVLLEKMGGLNPPISYSDDEFSVGTSPWDFGTCNGKLREVVPASPGQTLKFRILNTGSMYALRISFDGYRMTLVAADSEPIEPVEVDEVILHAAERFDVRITIPEDSEIGSRSWIRADTLESRAQGYQNGIRAILHIVDPNESTSVVSDAVPDPNSPIETTFDHRERLTYNCYSHVEALEASNDGGCLPVSVLPLESGGTSHGAVEAAKAASAPVETHIVDWQFSSSPQFAHFVRINGGTWNQFAMFAGHSMLLPDYDAESMLHPNGAVLNVDAGVGAIIIWRNKSTMDHPIHLHGRKMEILDEHIIRKADQCSHIKCPLSDAFTSDEAMRALADIPFGSRPLKDTFILPAGGAVATRIYTGEPALWFAHCHLEAHREDGMALILNVGNYLPPANSDWLPSDYPKCDTSFLLSKKEYPSCDCYINDDAVMDGELTKDHRCSRDFLCFHRDSPQSSLEEMPYESSGIAVRSQYSVPGWAISLVIVVLIALVSVIIAYRNKLLALSRRNNQNIDSDTKIDGSHDSTESEEQAIHTGVSAQLSEFPAVSNSTAGAEVAVLFVNFQNEFIAEKGMLHHLVVEGINDHNTLVKATELANVARQNGASIFHAPTILDSDDESDMSRYSSEDGLFRAGTWNSGLLPMLWGEGDMVFPTKSYNAFSQQMKDIIMEKNIKKLFVCGFLMEVSVLETTLGAIQELANEDVEVYIIEDCCVAKSMNARQEIIGLSIVTKMIDQMKAVEILSGLADLRGRSKRKVGQRWDQGLEATMPRDNRRTTVAVQVPRVLPLTMDLPGNNIRRSKRRATTAQFLVLDAVRASVAVFRRENTVSEPLPVAEKDFHVPPRRSTFEFEVEGFRTTGKITIDHEETDVNEQSPFWKQVMFLSSSQWMSYRPTCISLLRVGEVTSLAFFTGALFYDVGNDPTATGFGSINSLLFFSVTLWTFTRMYPAINTYFAWNEGLRIISYEHRYSIAPACLARCAVVLLAESGWPFLYVFVCYPLASLAGSWNSMFKIGLFLTLNNICYVSIGACLGISVGKVPRGMIASTIIAQSSLVMAGFYTEVPSFLSWLRYLSPVFWTYRGIVKSSFDWTDTFRCRWGSTLAGVNSCFIEYHTVINNLKDRGINVATFGDDQSTKIWLESIVLVVFYLAMQLFVVVLSLFRQRREDRWEARFERLAEYRAVYGDANVPVDCSVDGIDLGPWVDALKKQKKKLTAEQVERLNELEFVWE